MTTSQCCMNHMPGACFRLTCIRPASNSPCGESRHTCGSLARNRSSQVWVHRCHPTLQSQGIAVTSLLMYSSCGNGCPPKLRQASEVVVHGMAYPSCFQAMQHRGCLAVTASLTLSPAMHVTMPTEIRATKAVRVPPCTTHTAMSLPHELLARIAHLLVWNTGFTVFAASGYLRRICKL